MDFSRYPIALLPQYKPILFPYCRYFAEIQRFQPRSAHSSRKPSTVGQASFQKENLQSEHRQCYLTAGTRLQHIAGIYFHSYHLQSCLSWPQSSTVPRIDKSPLTSGTRLVHASGNRLHVSHLKSRVAWPETVAAASPTLPDQKVLLRHPMPIHSGSTRPSLMPPDLNIRIDTLNVDIDGRRYTSWGNLEPSIVGFIATHTYGPTKSQGLSLNVDWQEPTMDHLGDSGLLLFQSLFTLLIGEDQPHRSCARPISQFKNISISVPTMVKDQVNAKSFGSTNGENHGCIQLWRASSLREFSWSGHFMFFTSTFRSIPFLRLTVLQVSRCLISLEDALALLNNCPNLTTVSLDAIQHVEDSAYKLFGPRELPNIVLPFLDYMKITSSVPLCPLFHTLKWGAALRDLVLVLEEEGIQGITAYATHFQSVQNLSITGNLTGMDVVDLLTRVESLELNGHEIL